MWLVRKPVYFAPVNPQGCNQTVKSNCYMSQSVKVLSTKSSNHNIVYNNYTNHFQETDFVTWVVSSDCFEQNLTAILQAIPHIFNYDIQTDY